MDFSGIKKDRIREAFALPEAVEHRMESIAAYGGIRWVNDSKATTVNATLITLASYSGPLVLILGRRDEDQDYAALASYVRAQVKAIIVLGGASIRIDRAFSGLVDCVIHASGMADAVTWAVTLSRPGDTVILSPAATSLDMYHDFRHRGREFKAAVASVL